MTLFDWLNGGGYMPTKPMRICDKAGCYNKVPGTMRLCDLHRLEWRRVVDARRGPGSKRGAGRVSRMTRAYVAARSHWLCVLCKRPGHELDHITPTEAGGNDMSENLQWVCRECHRSKTARENAERTRRANTRGGAS